MDQDLYQEIAEISTERNSFYMLMYLLFYKEATEELIAALEARVRTLTFEEESALAAGWRELALCLKRKGPDPRTDFAVDYARCMLSAGIINGEAAVPFESIYTSKERLTHQEARDKVRAIYIAQGISVDQELNLPEDHLAFELEFLGIMAERACELAQAQDHDGLLANLMCQRSFMGDHLLNWIAAFEENLVACALTKFYVALTHIVQGFLEQDVALLDELIDLLGGAPYQRADDYVEGVAAVPEKKANVANVKYDDGSYVDDLPSE